MAHTGSTLASGHIVYIGGQVAPTERFNDVFVLDPGKHSYEGAVVSVCVCVFVCCRARVCYVRVFVHVCSCVCACVH